MTTKGQLRRWIEWCRGPLARRVQELETLNRGALADLNDLREFVVSLESEINAIRNAFPPRVQARLHPTRRRVKWSEFRQVASQHAKSVTIPSEES